MGHMVQELGAWDRAISTEGVHREFNVTERALYSVQQESAKVNTDGWSGLTRRGSSPR